MSVPPFTGSRCTLCCPVFIVTIILSKFQPAMVLLSGLIFTCPVPSPAVTLRVKSTRLMEFTMTTKVCEQKRNQITQTIHPLLSAWLHVGGVCMYDVVSTAPRKLPFKTDGSAFIVTFPAAFRRCWSYTAMQMTFLELVYPLIESENETF